MKIQSSTHPHADCNVRSRSLAHKSSLDDGRNEKHIKWLHKAILCKPRDRKLIRKDVTYTPKLKSPVELLNCGTVPPGCK